MKDQKGILNRPVTKEECPWLGSSLPKGKTVYRFSGHTYGVISSDGVAVTEVADKTPFFEVPKDAVDWEK